MRIGYSGSGITQSAIGVAWRDQTSIEQRDLRQRDMSTMVSMQARSGMRLHHTQRSSMW